MELIIPAGATPLEPEELEQLIPTHISLQSELNEYEQNNIIHAHNWLTTKRHNVLSIDFLKKLHLKMFAQTWRWAGHYRKSNKNIGVDWHLIPIELTKLIEDVKAQIEYKSYTPDEIATRFHHRLVAIHCFPNGNGRHARLACDALLIHLGLPKFTWGRMNLIDNNEVRKGYIQALQSADRHDYRPLIEFVRS